MKAAVLGIYGNSKEEAIYPVHSVDAEGKKLDGSHRYSLRPAPGKLPPIHMFWSLAMHELPSSFLVANPIDGHLFDISDVAEFQRRILMAASRC